MNFKEYYLNSGKQHTKIVEYCIQLLKFIDQNRNKATDKSFQTRLELEKKKIIKDLHDAYDKAMANFTSALKFENPDKQCYLERAYLNSSDTIWTNNIISLSKYELSHKYPDNYFLAIRDYENYFGIFTSFDRINKRIYNDYDAALKLIKCRYIVRNERYEYSLRAINYDSALSYSNDFDWKKLGEFVKIDRVNSNFESIYKEISELIKTHPDKLEAIKFRAEIVYAEREHLIERNQFVLDNYAWIKTNSQNELKNSNESKISGASYITQTIQDYNKLIEENINNGWLYYKRGMLHYILGSFQEANKDYETAKSLSENTHQVYVSYVKSVISNLNYKRDQEHREYIEWASGECACGESPCACSDKDN